MNKKDSKFFIIIGILLILVGIILIPDDEIIGIIGILFGSYNLFKGIQLARGVKPLVLRKQEENQKKIDDELKEKFDQSKRK